MFYNCQALSGTIDVTGWDVSNVTTLCATFCSCRFVSEIKGICNWPAMPKCTRIDSAFSSCNSITGDYDLSNLQLGKGTASITYAGAAFNGIGARTLSISGWNISACTSLSQLFSYCYNLVSLDMSNVTWPTANTTYYLMFYSCNALEEINLSGWDFSHLSGNSASVIQYFAYGCPKLRKITCTNCTPMANQVNDSSASYGYIYYNNYLLKELDSSWMNMSLFKGTATSLYAFRGLNGLVDFIPPTNITKSFWIKESYFLSKASILRIFNNLVDLTGKTAQTLSIGTVNLAKLTDAEKAIATGKNWTLA